MAGPSVTYTFTNGTVADASQINKNWIDLINGLTDGTKDLNINAITAAGTATFNGAVNLGNATGDAITVNGAFAGTGGDASATQSGLITTASQSFAGVKTFNDGLKLDDAAGQSTLNYYQQDDTTLAAVTFKGNAGGSNSAAIAIKITRIGRVVTLVIPVLSTIVPTNNSTALLSNTALPTWARPNTATTNYIAVANNGAVVSTVLGLFVTEGSGIMYIYRDDAGTAYTNSANAGWNGTLFITYTA